MDKLPECNIHKILSYLSFEAAAQTSILSKKWLQAWFTNPNLKVKVGYGKGNNNRKIVDKIMERYRERKIPIEKFELSVSTSAYHHPLAFPWIDKCLDIALQNGVKYLVCAVSVPSYPFPISTFLVSESLRELVLTGCDLMNLSLSTSQVANCQSLRKISLTDVRLDNNVLQTLLNYCPLIVDVIIMYCRLLTNIELRNLQNIKSVSILSSGSHNKSVKIQAPTLEHLSYSGSWKEFIVLDIVECQNLKSLKLSHMTISEGFLEHLISTSQFLESLLIDNVCGELERFNICGSQSLKVLGIQFCKDIGEIDASNLVSLEYMGSTIPELKIAKESGQLKNLRTNLSCYGHNDLNAAWFCKLRKFLSNLTSWSHLSLYFDKCNEINMKDLQVHYSVATSQVDVLTVWLKSSPVECPSFVDALIWSCHPRRLNFFSSTIEVITCFMDRLTYMKNSSHSTSHGRKPWHTQLYEVRAYKFGSAVELRSGELATLTEREDAGGAMASIRWITTMEIKPQ
ncbi:putative F-box/LRR-repeat protein At5g02700 [Lycium ferocissimum]|uniref:putative F-box/LRR-repeat protein At5g02700 n=1 Tax=Lycium ferocissimum TaxID=112874 RepID=UPI002814CBEA|nr:putative F-box/LRR-repeat protein At5g02700 [Lycium ferocissimum]